MIGVIVAFVVGLVVTIAATPLFIKLLVKHHYGQFIRQDGPTQHLTKRGTPTMGGVVIIVGTVLAWLAGNAVNGAWPDWSSILLIFLFLGLGLLGFLDDFIKIRNQRSLGLHAGAKIVGQLIVGTLFALGTLTRPDSRGITPGSLSISIARPTFITLAFGGVVLGIILYVIWANFLVSAWSNAVNLTDGLDGLATGTSAAVFSAYTLIAIWQELQSCAFNTVNAFACYDTRDPLGIAIVCAGVVGALLGFLWWNASPAQIFMGDTGSLALGGLFAGVSIVSNTEILALVIGGLFFIITMSDVIQIGVFKATHKRVFRMAPLHHHFELKGWKEVTIVVRFWIVAILFAVTGFVIFYAEWVSHLLGQG